MAMVAACIVWLVVTVFLGLGVYRLWRDIVAPVYISWALLPGTLVSEMAYIFGCLVTGGEIRHARLMPGSVSRRGKSKSDEPTTDATPRLKVIGPLVAALLAIVACGGAILLCNWLLGEAVVEKLGSPDWLRSTALPKELPGSWLGFWVAAERQVRLVRWSCESMGDLDWLNWRVPLFVYLALCLSVRLAPVGRDLRATLGAVVLIAAILALAGALSSRFRGAIDDLWALLTYVYATLMLMLLITLLIRAIVAMVRILSGKEIKNAS